MGEQSLIPSAALGPKEGLQVFCRPSTAALQFAAQCSRQFAVRFGQFGGRILQLEVVAEHREQITLVFSREPWTRIWCATRVHPEARVTPVALLEEVSQSLVAEQ